VYGVNHWIRFEAAPLVFKANDALISERPSEIVCECRAALPALTGHGLSSQLATRASRFKFHKRRQLFIRVHDDTLPVVAMRVSDNWHSRRSSQPLAVGMTSLAHARHIVEHRHQHRSAQQCSRLKLARFAAQMFT
jgi:hypothetical protein